MPLVLRLRLLGECGLSISCQITHPSSRLLNISVLWHRGELCNNAHVDSNWGFVVLIFSLILVSAFVKQTFLQSPI